MVPIHSPFVIGIGILGNVVSLFVYLAPMPTFYRIYKKKSTEGFRCFPYLVALFSSMLWLYYAYLKKDALLLITINSFGCIVESFYIIVFFFYAPKEAKKSTLMIFTAMNLGLFSLLILVTQFLANGHQRVVVFGWICVAISVSVFAAPLSIVAQVIRTKSVEFMPFNLSFFLTLSAIVWFGYGLLLRDLCIALPNVLGFLLGISQMLLYVIYKRLGNKMIILETKLSTDVMMSPIRTNEVHEVVLDIKVDYDAVRDQQNQEAENTGDKDGNPSNQDDSGDKSDSTNNECGV